MAKPTNLVALDRIKQRARSRRRQGGAVLFIVAMTLAVLAAIGAFALNSASIDIRTSGHERQSTQAHYLSEYGVLAVTSGANSTTAQVYLDLMNHRSAASGNTMDTGCVSLPGVDSANAPIELAACRRMGAAELGRSWSATSGDPFGTSPFGTAVPTTPDFFVELTEPVEVTPPDGFDIKSGLCFIQFTVSSIGLAQPKDSASKIQFTGVGEETARARISAGPVRGCKP